MYHVLVVEDDAPLQAALIRSLSARNCSVRPASTAAEALRLTASEDLDLIILDLGLPDLDGCAALRMIRGVSDVPVIVVTARREESSVIKLLDSGADDYVVKPFSSEQLIARMRALLRRTAPAEPVDRTFEVGDLKICTAQRIAVLAERQLDLTRREFDLLAYLAERAGCVVSRQAIMNDVWRESDRATDQSLDVHVSWLRRKLGESAAEPRFLHTVRGVGLKLAEPT